MRTKQLCGVSAISLLLMLVSVQLAPASLLGEALQYIVKAMPGQKPPIPSPSLSKPPATGLRGAVKALSELPHGERPDAQEIMNAYSTLLRRAGMNESIAATCSSCVSDLTLPNEAARAARLMLEKDRFLAGRAAGSDYRFGALDSYSMRTGVLPSEIVATERARVINALAETLDGLRAGPLEEAAFVNALEANLKKLAEEPDPVSRFGLDEVGYDDEKRMLTFAIRIGDTKVTIANLDIRRYVDRMQGLVFGGGGIYLLQSPTDDPANPQVVDLERLEAAKADQARDLAEADVACQHKRQACNGGSGIDPETGERLKEAVWSEALLEVLQARKKNRKN
jgi:hypothetical protein